MIAQNEPEKIDKRKIKYDPPDELKPIHSLPDEILQRIKENSNYEPTEEEQEQANELIYKRITNQLLEKWPRPMVAEVTTYGILARAITTREKIARAKEFKNCQEGLWVCKKECVIQIQFSEGGRMVTPTSPGLLVANVNERKKTVSCSPYSDTKAEIIIDKDVFYKSFKKTTLEQFRKG